MLKLSPLISLLVALVPAVPAVAQTRLPLDRPSVNSRLAESSVLTQVVSIGPRLLAVGERGHVVYSDDKGTTWQQGQTPTSVTLTSVAFSTGGKNGWAVGHGLLILGTSDAGATWTRLADGRTLQRAFSELAARGAAQRGGASLVAKARRLAEEGPDKPLLDVLAIDDLHLLAVGAYGVVLRSDDAGVTWLPAIDLIAPDDDRHIYAVRRIGSQLWMVGERGLMYRSTDEGRTFEPVAAPAKATVFSIAGHGELLVLTGLRGHLSVSRDGGSRWDRVAIATKNSLVDVTAMGKVASFLVAEDNGALWQLDAQSGQLRGPVGTAAFPIVSVTMGRDRAVHAAGLLGVAKVETNIPPLSTTRRE